MITTLPITLAISGLCGLLFLALCFNVVRFRAAGKISLGDGSNVSVPLGEEASAPKLLVAVRTHANFAEYVPLSLLLLALLELAGTGSTLLWALGLTLVVARVAHAIGMQRPAPNLFRAGGTLLQWAMLAVASVLALLAAF
jgi:uncharacterized protein